MKKILLLLVISLSTVACLDKTPTMEETVMHNATNTLKEYSHHPETSKVDNFETKYINDSLCIMHCNHTGKNGFGNEITSKVEYIYLIHNNVAYESVNNVDGTTIYQDQNAMETAKKGTIYQNCSYDDAIRYRAVYEINTQGRRVDKQDELINIPVPTRTGNWSLATYTDSFGDDTNEHFLFLVGKGTFSNTATTNSELSATLSIDTNSISIGLFEYNSMLAKDDDICKIKVKYPNGVTSDWVIQNNYSGRISLSNKQRQEFKEMAKEEGEISFSISKGRYTFSSYKFKFDLTGYNEALKHLE